MLNAVIPFCFQFPAKVKLKENDEQSEKPVKTIPTPKIYGFYMILANIMIPTEIANKVVLTINVFATSFIYLDRKIRAIPPRN